MTALSGFLGRLQANFFADPATLLFYLAFVGAVAALAAFGLIRKRADITFWSIAALISASILLTNMEQMDDTEHHVYRTIALVQQLRSGHLSLMVQNDLTGETLPVFLFYSFVPYILPALISLCGVSAALAYKATMVFYLLLMAAGLAVMVRATFRREDVETAFLACTLFLGSEYIVSNWINRSALAEVCVVALIPWAVTFSVGARRSFPRLIAVTCLQMICHPIVIIHALIGQSSISILLTDKNRGRAFWSIVLATAIAALLAIPFWLPQAFWEATTLGPRALTLPYAGTFLKPYEVLLPLYPHSIGIWLILGIVLLAGSIVRSRRFFDIFVLFGFFVILALQTSPFYAVTSAIPLLSKGALVWRLMVACAALALGLILAASSGRGMRSLRLLAAGSLATLVAFAAGSSVNHTARAFSPKDDAAAYKAYSMPERTFGGLEFYPDYAKFPSICPEPDDRSAEPRLNGERMETIRYAELRKGAHASSRYITVPGGPYDYVTYLANGAPVALRGSCGLALVLGPVAPGTTVTADESRLDQLLIVRLLFAAMILGASTIFIAASLLAQARRPADVRGLASSISG